MDTEIPEGLTRLTVNLIPRSRQALYATAEVTELRKTDIVNRALQFYAVLVEAAATGRSVKLVADVLGDDDMFDVIVRPADRRRRRRK